MRGLSVVDGYLIGKQINFDNYFQSQQMSMAVDPRLALLNRAFAFLIIFIELGIMFAYGFSTKFTMLATTLPQIDYSSEILLYTFTALLAILGYGLLIAYSDNSAIAGFVTTLIVLSISVQGTPLLLQFWKNVFASFGPDPQLSLSIQRQTMALCSSLLVSFAAFSGRLGNLEILFVTLLYNMGWTFSFILSQYLHAQKGPSPSGLYDDYGTNFIYVFAGFFALIFSLVINREKGKNSATGSRHSAFIAMIGTGFIFACFPFSGILYPASAVGNNLRRTEGPLNIYFALTASVISTYIFSAIFGKLKVGVRESLLGVISGGVTIGVVGGTINNIGACIAIGAFSGLLSSLYYRLIHAKSLFVQTIDHLGIIGPILLCSVFGGLGLAPILYAAYKNLGTSTSTLIGMANINDNNFINYQLVNIGVAAGTAIFTGLLSAIFPYCLRKYHAKTDFKYSKLVSLDFGLYQEENEEKHKNRIAEAI